MPTRNSLNQFEHFQRTYHHMNNEMTTECISYQCITINN
jgi:hypothetical protein